MTHTVSEYETVGNADQDVNTSSIVFDGNSSSIAPFVQCTASQNWRR